MKCKIGPVLIHWSLRLLWITHQYKKSTSKGIFNPMRAKGAQDDHREDHLEMQLMSNIYAMIISKAMKFIESVSPFCEKLRPCCNNCAKYQPSWAWGGRGCGYEHQCNWPALHIFKYNRHVDEMIPPLLEKVIMYWNGDFGEDEPHITAPWRCLWTKHQVEWGWQGCIEEVVASQAHCFCSGKVIKQVVMFNNFVSNI